jgi:hypothetical protein
MAVKSIEGYSMPHSQGHLPFHSLADVLLRVHILCWTRTKGMKENVEIMHFPILRGYCYKKPCLLQAI